MSVSVREATNLRLTLFFADVMLLGPLDQIFEVFIHGVRSRLTKIKQRKPFDMNQSPYNWL
jgi:hypothetical protein